MLLRGLKTSVKTICKKKKPSRDHRKLYKFVGLIDRKSDVEIKKAG